MPGFRTLLLCLLSLGLSVGATDVRGQEAHDTVEHTIRQADHIKTSDNARFAKVLIELKSRRKEFSADEAEWFTFLQAWQVAYLGNLNSTIPKLAQMAESAVDPVVRFRARSSLVVMLINVSRYQDAYSGLNKLLRQLPSISNPYDRSQGLIAAGVVLADGGQYELAVDYADKAFNATQRHAVKCYANYIRYLAFYKKGALEASAAEQANAIAPCLSDNDLVIANSIRVLFITKWLQDGESGRALEALNRHYAESVKTSYWELAAQFESLLATAYWQSGQLERAESMALRVVEHRSGNQHTQAQRDSYEVLVQVNTARRQWRQALEWQKKYMIADKGYLNEVSTRALAYQKVRQQVAASQAQATVAERQIRILQLQQSLSQKSAETNRLYAVLLGLLVVTLGLWTWRLARSRRRYRRLARRDSLTGIFNRQHFLDAVSRRLDYCQRSQRDASLILIDLDHFKRVNDDNGHATGDAVLQRTVAVCTGQLRSVDIYGRIGGEEFGIFLPECDLECAMACAERIRAAIAGAVPHQAESQVKITASFGVSDVRHSGYRLKDLLSHADQALYRAKRAGRNRVAA